MNDLNIEQWLPYLEKAIKAARILETRGAFTVKKYHNDWPSVEMLEQLYLTLNRIRESKCVQ